MCGDNIPTLLAAFHKAMLIDSNLLKKYQIFKSYHDASIYNPFIRKMQSDKTNPFRRKTNQEDKENKRRGPLSLEEKQRRRAKGLCMYCGADGHLVAGCPKVPKN